MKNNNSIWTYLFKPFQFLAGYQALFIGITILLLLSILGYFSGTVFNGAIDAHFGASNFSYKIHLWFLFSGWLVLAAILFFAAKIMSKSAVRFVDMTGTLACAKAPYIIFTIIGFIPSLRFFDTPYLDIASIQTFLSTHVFLMILISVVTILALVWSIALMYNAFSISANLKDSKGVWTFAISLIVAEVVSLILNYFVVPILK